MMLKLVDVPKTMDAKLQNVAGRWYLHLSGHAEQIRLWDLVGQPTERVQLKVTFGPSTKIGPHQNPFDIQIDDGFRSESEVIVDMNGLQLIAAAPPR